MKIGAIRLCVCLVAFLALYIVKVLFPASFEGGLAEKINADVDYPTALKTIGEAFAGEVGFDDAVATVYQTIFSGGEEGGIYVSNSNEAEVNADEEKS